MERRPASGVTLRAGSDGALTHVQPEGSAFALRAASTAVFKVTYTGFTPAARAAFQRAVNIWSSSISAAVPITIAAKFRPLGASILGSARSDSVWSSFPGAVRSDTWYVDALANQQHGSQLAPEPDIVASFNSDVSNWHFGEGAAPAGKYDFATAVLHEIGHGLGFVGSGDITANRGTVRTAGLPYIFDLYTENRQARRLLRFPDNSTRLAAQLRAGNVFFDSGMVRAANGDLRVRLYAPPVFEQEVSYSHLDEATYRRGNPNSLMTPRLGMGESIRTPGPITLAIFRTMGW